MPIVDGAEVTFERRTRISGGRTRICAGVEEFDAGVVHLAGEVEVFFDSRTRIYDRRTKSCAGGWTSYGGRRALQESLEGKTERRLGRFIDLRRFGAELELGAPRFHFAARTFSATCWAETITGVMPPPGRVQWPTQ